MGGERKEKREVDQRGGGLKRVPFSPERETGPGKVDLHVRTSLPRVFQGPRGIRSTRCLL